jgi:FtsH-binding integral membrane protein
MVPDASKRCMTAATTRSAGRKAVIGTLSLYLDFINLFMMLLRLLGNRR